MNKTDTTYSIGAVSKVTGVEKHKLRHWSDRYLTHIERIQIGGITQRRFTEKDIELIKRIDQLMKDGHTLKSAAEKSIKQFKEE